MAQFIKKIQNFAFQNNLWEKNSKIIVGVSGGADSVCLLDVFSKLASKYNFKLHIVHVNYALRGKDSKQDEIFVKRLAEKYKIDITILNPKKTDIAPTKRGNLENNLREIRYDFFEKLRKDFDFDLVAVAHNQDDQAETILMRIIRGSGLAGLCAMKAKTRNIIRPLLQTSKKEILFYVKQNKLKFRIDNSNFDTKFTRNNIRHKLLPYLEKNFNLAIKKILSEWSVAVADDYEFIHSQAQTFADMACKNKCAHFNSRDLLLLHPAIIRQVLRNIVSKLKENTTDLENKQIEEIIKIIKSTKNKSQKASISGLNILKKGDKVDISL